MTSIANSPRRAKPRRLQSKLTDTSGVTGYILNLRFRPDMKQPKIRGLFVLLILLSVPVFAQCTGGSPTWTCADTGNALTNGSNLENLLESGSIRCGDTILLRAGASYNAIPGKPFRLMQ